ncbi:MAG: riboflavin synthase [Acidimicrobiia bacterium]|nr:riboflavin synthase [Acidimicrobiia bacterium]
MFTGIVEELGSVRSMVLHDGGGRLEIDCTAVLADAEIGSSIAVNGCCLTVVEIGDGWWAADVQLESLDRTTLRSAQAGDPINLERPMRLGHRLDGHLVQGHVDGVGSVLVREAQTDSSEVVTIAADSSITRYIVEKGSITVDGVSLTVTSLDEFSFSVALIPHTLAVTTLGARQPGDGVNLEVDVLAKYVERLLTAYPRSTS